MGKTHYMLTTQKSACGRKITNEFDVCVSWIITDCKQCLKYKEKNEMSR